MSGRDLISLFFTGVLAICACLTLILIFAQVIIYGSQLWQMKKSTNAATKAAKAAEESVKLTKESSRRDQRAWVAFTGVSGGSPAPDAPLIIKVKAKNAGKTFARNFRMYAYFLDVPQGGKPDFSEDDKPHPGGSVFVLSPNGEWESNTDVMAGVTPTGKVTQAQIDDWKSGRKTFLVCAKLTYDDIFGCHHWTTFCNQLSKDFSYRAYEEHNDADEDGCP